MGSKEELVLLKQIESYDLLGKLIQQVHKDADLAGASFICEQGISAKEFISEIYSFLFKFKNTDFGTYLNFLYRVDIPESALKSITEIEAELIVKEVTNHVLQRECQKVWFRNKNQ